MLLKVTSVTTRQNFPSKVLPLGKIFLALGKIFLERLFYKIT